MKNYLYLLFLKLQIITEKSLKDFLNGWIIKKVHILRYIYLDYIRQNHETFH